VATEARDELGFAAAGLTALEAAARLSRDGPNVLPDPDRRAPWRIVLEVMREPMFALLIGGGLVYLALGDRTEALMLLLFASISVVVTVVQELRSERVLEALRDLTSPRAIVVRDGQPIRIPGVEVVRGDLMAVAEGDRVAADGRLLRGAELQVDESLLTGESVPVDKAPAHSGSDTASAIFSGTLVVRGEGMAEVTETGQHTTIGQIGQSLRSLGREAPALSRQVRHLVRAVAAIGFVVCALVVILIGLASGAWLKGLLAGIALGMALLPEEFPLVLSVFMVMGAWRISQSRVLTRRADAIEALGSATVLCTDKTGTLTQNRMTVIAAWRDGETFEIAPGESPPEPLVMLARTGALASSERPFDPMEKAFHAAVSPWTPTMDRLALDRVWGLRPDRPAVGQAWAAADGAPGLIAVKGAPETVVRLCRLDAARGAEVLGAAATFAARGARVLGVAQGAYERVAGESALESFELRFLGLIALADPLRPDVPEAVRQCRTAGVIVVMITGDHPATARAIADQAGIASGETLTGDELDRLSDEHLAARALSISVFARVHPGQKLRIVQALKAAGQVVAMTGDGVNDAPALKAADIGVAMGRRGSEVAREASSLVLLDDDFGSLVRTIRLGRRIYDNLQKAISFIVAVHVPLVAMALLPLLLGLPMFLAPVHIAFIEMIIDPACSLVFEAEREEADVMGRPPRQPQQPLFSHARIGWSAAQGFLAAAITAAVYLLCIGRGLPDTEVRATAFLALVGLDLSLILVNRTATASAMEALARPNPWLWPIIGGVALVLGVALSAPSFGRLFEFGHTRPSDVAIGLAAGLVGFVLLEGLQRLRIALERRATASIDASAA
jgi:Ca2+-transporting ATPase